MEWKNLPCSDVIKLWWIPGILSVFVLYIDNICWTMNGGSNYYLGPEQHVQDLLVLYKITFYTKFYFNIRKHPFYNFHKFIFNVA